MPETVQVNLQGKVYQLPAGETLGDALVRLSIPAQTVLAVRDGELIDITAQLHPGDQVKLVRLQVGG